MRMIRETVSYKFIMCFCLCTHWCLPSKGSEFVLALESVNIRENMRIWEMQTQRRYV
jgi:hypothetical protein